MVLTGHGCQRAAVAARMQPEAGLFSSRSSSAGSAEEQGKIGREKMPATRGLQQDQIHRRASAALFSIAPIGP